MRTYDVICPCCGYVNHNLFLAETDGWMECEYCRSVTRAEKYRDQKKNYKKLKLIQQKKLHVEVC